MATMRRAIATLAIPIWTAAACLAQIPDSRAADPAEGSQYAVSLFGGRMTDRNWGEIATADNVGFTDPYLAGAAVSWRLTTLFDALDLELEGQVVRHFHGESHWEFNVPVVARWRSFPWNETVPTTVAFGIGPSVATETPAGEVARHGDSQPAMVYWVAEVEVGLPDQPLSLIARLHHRSPAWGLVGDEGGSNWIVLGARWRF